LSSLTWNAIDIVMKRTEFSLTHIWKYSRKCNICANYLIPGHEEYELADQKAKILLI